jgi:photosystem II stability/assembly factor-like uncharacterized protein
MAQRLQIRARLGWFSQLAQSGVFIGMCYRREQLSSWRSYTLTRMRWVRLAAALGVVSLFALSAAFGQRSGGWSCVALGEATVYWAHTSVSATGQPVVFARTADAGVLRREGRGQWQSVALPPGCPTAEANIVRAPTDESFRYASCRTPAGTTQLFASENGGSDWRPLDPDHEGIVVDPTVPTRIFSYVFTPSPCQPCGLAFYVSTDGGRTWAPFWPGGSGGYSVASSPLNPSLVFVFIRDFVYYPDGGFTGSTDGGATWGTSLSGLESTLVAGALEPDNPSVVVGAQRVGGIARSTDSGDSWAVVNSDNFFEFTFAKTTTTSGALGLYAASESGGVSRSLDFGATWEPFSEGLPPGEGRDLVASTDGIVLYVIGEEGHLYEREIAASTVEGIRLPTTPSVSGR